MKMYEVKYESGECMIMFANCRADVWHKHPKAWLVNEVVIK